MKRTLMILLVVAPVLASAQGKRADFAGTWALDLKKSVNLPKQFSTVESFVLDIQQAGDTVTVLATMKGSGQTVPFPAFVYVMDGKEGHRSDTLRGSERWIKAKWGEDGKSATMDSRVRLTVPGKPPTDMRQHDDWKRLNDSTISISLTQKLGGTDSTRTEQRIFRKRK